MMRYYYTSNETINEGRGRSVSVPQLASIIQRDVEYGKWNVYNGGEEDGEVASCQYKNGNFKYHNKLCIYGKKEEFKRLEELIKKIIKVEPRKFII